MAGSALAPPTFLISSPATLVCFVPFEQAKPAFILGPLHPCPLPGMLFIHIISSLAPSQLFGSQLKCDLVLQRNLRQNPFMFPGIQA